MFPSRAFIIYINSIAKNQTKQPLFPFSEHNFYLCLVYTSVYAPGVAPNLYIYCVSPEKCHQHHFQTNAHIHKIRTHNTIFIYAYLMSLFMLKQWKDSQRDDKSSSSSQSHRMVSIIIFFHSFVFITGGHYCVYYYIQHIWAWASMLSTRLSYWNTPMNGKIDKSCNKIVLQCITRQHFLFDVELYGLFSVDTQKLTVAFTIIIKMCWFWWRRFGYYGTHIFTMLQYIGRQYTLSAFT